MNNNKGWVVVLDSFYWNDILRCTYASKGTKKASVLQPVIMPQNEGVCRMQLSSNCFVGFKRDPLKRHKSLQLPQTKADSFYFPAITSPTLSFINTWVRIDRFASLFLTISLANPYFGSVFFFFSFFWWIYYHKFSQIHTWMSLLMRPHYHFRQSRRWFYLLFIETRCLKENGRSEQ